MCILIKTLKSPKSVNNFSAEEWQTLMLQAKKSNLFGRLSYLLKASDLPIPNSLQWHFDAYDKKARMQQRQVKYEFKILNETFKPFSSGYKLLKGAAYIAHDLANAQGRSFSDIDILVERKTLGAMELRLRIAGWLRTEIDDYDDKYYREWMHEIPPLFHKDRATVLDVHHNILPKTNKHHFNAEQFQYQTVEIENIGSVTTLTYLDMFIHCAVHLMTESEFHNGLRDIVDLDSLATEFSNKNTDFTTELYQRSLELGVESYVYLALRYVAGIMENPSAKKALENFKSTSTSHLWLWDFAFFNVLKPDTHDCRNYKTFIAKFLLYWRGHLNRMPLHLLVPHLFKKSYMKIKDSLDKGKSIEGQHLP
ncbi:nucleotidyltransferase family protein [Catenovulum adriaticum]|uniref:Nucleotidyltransferase family protein n=1 Tax=Catenovulum adriaticum TaxID=2984846 RepID=A0ABY7APL8_9ALTE|nr:nucleotidyltransferase family protein [Catenovulum sp. TS8]WAJ70677.1 nucleotidyltransferase family protein [Catenovulum sp. TS8]